MSDPPVTVIRASPAEEADIRRRVREVDPASLGPDRVIATPARYWSMMDWMPARTWSSIWPRGDRGLPRCAACRRGP